MIPILAKMIYQDFGIGEGSQSGASSGLALLLLGLVIGVVGTTALFVWLAARERKERHHAHSEEVAAVIEEVFGEENGTAGGTKTGSRAGGRLRDRRAAKVPREPWERGADWWQQHK